MAATTRTPILCIVPKCKEAALPRSARCSGHQVPPKTLRQLVETGPHFVEEIPDRDGRRCVCGDGTSPRDKETGLCRSCWRAWRWSPIREREAT